MSHRKKVLLIQTVLKPPGGNNVVAVWIMEALKGEHSLSVLTWEAPDLEEINRFYGTSLKSSEFTVHHVNPLVRTVVKLDPDPGSFQKTSYLMRLCKRLKKDYDVVISADDEMDFGRRGIQYLHYPYLCEQIQPGIDSHWYRKLPGIFNGNYRLWMLVAGFSYRRMTDNLTLANSDWTGNKIKEFYGIDAVTVYPPVSGDFPDVSWEKKENGFVCIGSFHPVKRFENIIGILSKVKMRTRDLHLHIVGAKPGASYSHDYYERLKSLVRENSSWIFLHENLPRKQLLELIAAQRYGIHAHREEHFGIAVAEMLKAGCIPFVPNNGGQVEIVGRDERLVYENEEEAVEKIVRIVGNPEEQNSIRSYLNPRKRLFSAEKFMSEIREVVKRFCSSHLCSLDE